MFEQSVRLVEGMWVTLNTGDKVYVKSFGFGDKVIVHQLERGLFQVERGEIITHRCQNCGLVFFGVPSIISRGNSECFCHECYEALLEDEARYLTTHYTNGLPR